MSMSMIDLQAVRQQTPGVGHRIHLNNAGAVLMPLPVYEAVTEHLRRELEIGGYEAAHERANALNTVYDRVKAHR